jgi:putative redox protein
MADHTDRTASTTARPAHGTVIACERGAGRFALDVTAGPHRLAADEPKAGGGDDIGPTPYELLGAALAACTAMTLRLYAERKGWPLGRVSVAVRHSKVHAQDCADCETGNARVDRFERVIEVAGEVLEERRAKLLEIADKCPVHRTLEGPVEVVTRLTGGDA